MKSKNQLLKCVIAASILGQSFGANAEIDYNPFTNQYVGVTGMITAGSISWLAIDIAGAIKSKSAVESLSGKIKLMQQDIIVKRYTYTRKLLEILKEQKRQYHPSHFDTPARLLEYANRVYSRNSFNLNSLKEDLESLNKIKKNPSLFVFSSETVEEFLMKIKNLESQVASYESLVSNDIAQIASLEQRLANLKPAIEAIESRIKKQQVMAVNALLKSKKGVSDFFYIDKAGKIIDPKTGKEVGEGFLNHLKSVEHHVERRRDVIRKIQIRLQSIRSPARKIFVALVAGVSGSIYFATLPDGALLDLFSVDTDSERERILNDMSDQERADVVKFLIQQEF